MQHKRLAHSLLRALRRLIPRRLHTRGLRAQARVDELTHAQRERLRRNLRAMLVADTVSETA